MGTEIPEPITPDPVAPGDTCSVCWGVGKAFGDIDTPSSIILNFSGISKSPTWMSGDPEPLDGAFLFTQDLSTPCEFDDTTAGLVGTVFFLPDTTQIRVDEIFGPVMFSGLSDNACELLIDNTGTVIFEGGSCLITLPETT